MSSLSGKRKFSSFEPSSSSFSQRKKRTRNMKNLGNISGGGGDGLQEYNSLFLFNPNFVNSLLNNITQEVRGSSNNYTSSELETVAPKIFHGQFQESGLLTNPSTKVLKTPENAVKEMNSSILSGGMSNATPTPESKAGASTTFSQKLKSKSKSMRRFMRFIAMSYYQNAVLNKQINALIKTMANNSKQLIISNYTEKLNLLTKIEKSQKKNLNKNSNFGCGELMHNQVNSSYESNYFPTPLYVSKTNNKTEWKCFNTMTTHSYENLTISSSNLTQMIVSLRGSRSNEVIGSTLIPHQFDLRFRVQPVTSYSTDPNSGTTSFELVSIPFSFRLMVVWDFQPNATPMKLDDLLTDMIVISQTIENPNDPNSPITTWISTPQVNASSGANPSNFRRFQILHDSVVNSASMDYERSQTNSNANNAMPLCSGNFLLNLDQVSNQNLMNSCYSPLVSRILVNASVINENSIETGQLWVITIPIQTNSQETPETKSTMPIPSVEFNGRLYYTDTNSSK